MKTTVKITFRPLIAAFLLIFSGSFVSAQYGFNIGLMKNNVLSQRFQPANIVRGYSPMSEGSGEDYVFKLGFDGGAWFYNSATHLGGVFAENWNLSYPTRKRFVDNSPNGITLNGGYFIGLLNLNVAIKGRPWNFFINQYATAGASTRGQGVFALALLGNKYFQGKTLTNKSLDAALYNVREIGVGTGFKFGKIALGVRVKALLGGSFQQIVNTNLTTYTEVDGTRLDISGNYTWNRSATTGANTFYKVQGAGLAADLGLTWEVTDFLTVSAGALDLGGTVWWNAQKNEADVDVSFEGIEITSLFSDNVSDEMEGQVDSLRQAIFPDTQIVTHFMQTPAWVHAGVEWKLTEKDLLAGKIIYSPFSNGAYTRFPMLNVSYVRTLHEVISIGVNGFGGGTGMYGFGLFAEMNFPIASKFMLNVHLGADDLTGFIPSVGRGASIYGGLGLGMLKN